MLIHGLQNFQSLNQAWWYTPFIPVLPRWGWKHQKFMIIPASPSYTKHLMVIRLPQAGQGQPKDSKLLLYEGLVQHFCLDLKSFLLQYCLFPLCTLLSILPDSAHWGLIYLQRLLLGLPASAQVCLQLTPVIQDHSAQGCLLVYGLALSS